MKHNHFDRWSAQFLTLVSYPFEIERRESRITTWKKRSESRSINLTRSKITFRSPDAKMQFRIKHVVYNKAARGSAIGQGIRSKAAFSCSVHGTQNSKSILVA